jgi:hypothetical protein
MDSTFISPDLNKLGPSRRIDNDHLDGLAGAGRAHHYHLLPSHHLLAHLFAKKVFQERINKLV